MPFANAFLNPGLLGWLSLAAVPIVIHLLFRRRTRRVEWAAMQFLERAHKRTKRRIQLENLLLLLLRVAAVALLVFAAARPLLQSTNPVAGLAHTPTHAVIIVDVSGSMSLDTGGVGKPLDDAKTAARKLIESLDASAGDTVEIIAHASPPDTRSRGPGGYVDPEAMRRHLETLVVPTARATSFADALERARVKLASHPTGRVVYWISDFQCTGFEVDGEVSDAVRTAMARLLEDANTRVVVIDVGAPATHPANCGITALETPPRVITTAESTAIVARVRNFGTAAARVGVRFFVDEDETPRGFAAPQEIEPGEEATFLFRNRRFEREGAIRIKAELDPPDAFRIDDRRDLVLTVRKRVRALLVDGTPQNTDAFTNATDYLATALNPFAADGDEQGPFAPDVIPWHEWPRVDLDGYDLVVLANVAVPGDSEVDELAAFVRAGGGLVITWGSNLDDPGAFRDRFVRRGLAPLVPAEATGDAAWNEPGATPRRLRFDPTHAATRSFAANEVMTSLVEQVRVGRYAPATPVADDAGAVSVLARFDDENTTPAVAERVVGAGRVLMLMTSADTSWTNLPDTPIFLPLVHALASRALQPVRDPLNLTIGDRVRRLLGEPTPFELTSPDGEPTTRQPAEVPGSGDKGATRYTLESEPLLERGVYRLRPAKADGATELIAVNPDAIESDLRRYRASDLRVDVLPGQKFEVLEADAIAVAADRDARGGEVWKFLVGAVIAFLLAESWFAQRTGARKA